jgi:predicted secreted protein
MMTKLALSICALVALTAVNSEAKKTTKRNVLSTEPEASVTRKCIACEKTIGALHAVLKIKEKRTESWRKTIKKLCADALPGAHQGCEDFLTDFNLQMISSEAEDLTEDPDWKTSALEFQFEMCMSMTSSCPQSYSFKPADGGVNEHGVTATFVSTLKQGDVRIYWLDSMNPREEPEHPHVLLTPGASINQATYKFHRFRLLAPGAKWNSFQNSVDVTISPEHGRQVTLRPLKRPRHAMMPLGL